MENWAGPISCPLCKENLRRMIPMNAYVASVIENVKKKHSNEPECLRTVEEV